jgi:RND family efflux transporter MFP subunit
MAATAILSMLLIGAGGMYLLMRDNRVPDGVQAGARGGTVAPASATAPASAGMAGTQADVVVTITKEAADRAGIRVTLVAAQPATESLRVPGVVEPNAYRQVTVTPLVAGRVVRVEAQLGDRVRKGQSIAQVFSPELAEARTKYVAARAMLDAHDRELQRSQKLVEIGAASRQELDRIHAEHAAQTAEVESARARLRLLGADADEEASASNGQENATTNVPAPIDGVVTERAVNVGVNVDPTTKLFAIVDLSNVWMVADVYERDLHLVREGARAIITPNAYPDERLEGRVSFIDPQLDAGTRTAKIRVEVGNPRGRLRLGMYADVAFESASVMPIVAVPRNAVQSIGERQVVYLSSPSAPDKFSEREVRLGRVLGDQVEVVGGLSVGDPVVSSGSFYVRAEAERLGLRGPQRTSASLPSAAAREGAADVQVANIAVTEKGFEPEKVSLRAGVPARLTFTRTSEKTCATEVVFPSLNIKRSLPLNEAVAIDFTPSKSSDLNFACGMNMLKGTVAVQ